MKNIPKNGSLYDDRGFQWCDQTPVEMPLGYSPPESLASMVERLCSMQDFRKQQEKAGNETFEEADDFDVGDEDEPMFVGHEFTEMAEEELRVEARRAADEEVDRIIAKRDTQRPTPSEAVSSPTASQGPSGSTVSTT